MCTYDVDVIEQSCNGDDAVSGSGGRVVVHSHLLEEEHLDEPVGGVEGRSGEIWADMRRHILTNLSVGEEEERG